MSNSHSLWFLFMRAFVWVATGSSTDMTLNPEVRRDTKDSEFVKSVRNKSAQHNV